MIYKLAETFNLEHLSLRRSRRWFGHIADFVCRRVLSNRKVLGNYVSPEFYFGGFSEFLLPEKPPMSKSLGVSPELEVSPLL